MTFASRFHRIIALAYSVIFVCAVILFVFLFQENREARLNSIRLRLIEQSQSLDALLRVRYDAVNAMRSQAEDFLRYRYRQEVLPPLRLSNVPDRGYFHLDVPEANFHRVGNITGEGYVEDISPEMLEEIEMAYALNPLFKVLKENIKTAIFLHYTSKRGFRNLYPWRPSSESRFFFSSLKKDYFEAALPENNSEHKIFWTDAFLGAATDELMLTCAAPVYHKKEMRGVVAMDFTLAAVEYFIDRIHYQDGRFLIVNDKSTILSDTDDSIEPARIVKIQEVLPAGLTLDMINSGEDFSLFSAGDYWVFHATPDYAPWRVIYYIKAADINLFTLRNIGPSVILVLVFAMFFLIFSNKLISREFIQPAQRLVNHIANQATSPPTNYQDVLEPWHSWFEAVSRVFDENRKLVIKLEEHIFDLDRKVHERTKAISSKNRELQKALVDLRKAQDQIIVQEKLAGLGAITAGISHEIKNPLNFIINFSEVSREFLQELLSKVQACRNDLPADYISEIDNLSQSLTDNMKRVETHAKRADAIVRSMLTHAKGGQDAPQFTDLHDLLDENLLLATSSFKRVGMVPEVVKNYDNTLEKIAIYRQELGRVLLNILSNACYILDQKLKKLPDFVPVIQIVTLNHGRTIEIRIRDNGLGMSPAIKRQVFNPFFTTKPTGSGTGLGLSLSYDIIVNQHHGEIQIDTREGEYTEFIIILPKKLE
jgi:signal transduction histidine kinase